MRACLLLAGLSLLSACRNSPTNDFLDRLDRPADQAVPVTFDTNVGPLDATLLPQQLICLHQANQQDDRVVFLVQNVDLPVRGIEMRAVTARDPALQALLKQRYFRLPADDWAAITADSLTCQTQGRLTGLTQFRAAAAVWSTQTGQRIEKARAARNVETLQERAGPTGTLPFTAQTTIGPVSGRLGVTDLLCLAMTAQETTLEPDQRSRSYQANMPHREALLKFAPPGRIAATTDAYVLSLDILDAAAQEELLERVPKPPYRSYLLDAHGCDPVALGLKMTALFTEARKEKQ